jgi:hypothetical protein
MDKTDGEADVELLLSRGESLVDEVNLGMLGQGETWMSPRWPCAICFINHDSAPKSKMMSLPSVLRDCDKCAEDSLVVRWLAETSRQW